MTAEVKGDTSDFLRAAELQLTACPVNSCASRAAQRWQKVADGDGAVMWHLLDLWPTFFGWPLVWRKVSRVRDRLSADLQVLVPNPNLSAESAADNTRPSPWSQNTVLKYFDLDHPLKLGRVYSWCRSRSYKLYVYSLWNQLYVTISQVKKTSFIIVINAQTGDWRVHIRIYGSVKHDLW